MKVFKFGGALLKDSDSVRNVAKLLRKFSDTNLLIVVSAMEKTTNHLEELAAAYFYEDAEIEQIFNSIRNFHMKIAEELFLEKQHPAIRQLEELFDKLWEYTMGEPTGNYDYEYDQIVSFGELFSSVIVSHYLDRSGLVNTWFDARELIITDDRYREGRVIWESTEQAIREKMGNFFKPPLFHNMALSQGFIAASFDNTTTTLAREGSDYSAAIFAYALDAEEVVIWKDVPGLLNANPKHYPEAKLIPRISYSEALELSYYGASVLHPNTIKPLQNKHIPLSIRPFYDPDALGTLISDDTENDNIQPSFIIKPDQVLLSFSSRDFSYIDEKKLYLIFGVFSSLNIKINLMQNSAMSFSVCFDQPGAKLDELMGELQDEFKILYNIDLKLITVRNYQQGLIDTIIGNSEILLEQKSRYTFQAVIQ